MIIPNSIINDDCFNTLKLVKDNSIDLIITDPPYIISKKSNFVKHSDNIKFNKIIGVIVLIRELSTHKVMLLKEDLIKHLL
jgi:DNA modification methylase